MKKVWKSHRKGRAGTYVEWYDDAGRRRCKYFSPQFKSLIEGYITRKFVELNSDVRPVGSLIAMDLETMTEEYIHKLKADRLASSTVNEIERVLKDFAEVTKVHTSDKITPARVTKFRGYLGEIISKRTKRKLTKDTVNKYMRYVKAFLNWGKEMKYTSPDLKVLKVDGSAKQGHILSDNEIGELLQACANPLWRMRVLLALCTGLRRSDIENLKVRDVNVELKTVTIIDQKTGKVTNHQPLPDDIMPVIHEYLCSEVKEGQVKLFATTFTKQWEKIRTRAKLEHVTFHDLRRTFVSRQADAGVSPKALQEMLNHSSIDTTMKHYIRTGDTEKRKGVNKLKVQSWIDHATSSSMSKKSSSNSDNT